MSAQLPPGPELDREIAEKVMGWHEHAMQSGSFVWVEADGRVANLWYSRPESVMPGGGCLFSPSTDFGHCQPVIDALVKRGFEVDMRVYPDGSVLVMISDPTVPRGYRERGVAGTMIPPGAQALPHAICLAALKAVEHE